MKRLYILIMTVTLTACAAKVPWTNAALPKSQWSKDWSECKRSAEFHAGGFRDWDEKNPLDPFAEYERQRAAEQAKTEITLCMIGRGYVPVERQR